MGTSDAEVIVTYYGDAYDPAPGSVIPAEEEED